jgi:hypothetical protein
MRSALKLMGAGILMYCALVCGRSTVVAQESGPDYSFSALPGLQFESATFGASNTACYVFSYLAPQPLAKACSSNFQAHLYTPSGYTWYCADPAQCTPSVQNYYTWIDRWGNCQLGTPTNGGTLYRLVTTTYPTENTVVGYGYLYCIEGTNSGQVPIVLTNGCGELTCRFYGTCTTNGCTLFCCCTNFTPQ